MQTGNEQLKRQQLILKLKDFYRGQLDGVWSEKTIAAKKAFEAKGFAPGIPNNGLPFANTGPYPKGIRMGKDGLLTCAEVEEYLRSEANGSKKKVDKPEQEPEAEK